MTYDAPEPHLSLTEAPLTRRASVIAGSGLATSLLIAVLTMIPAPYAIGTPGPTFDTLGDLDGIALVEIDGTPTFETSGELRLTTVSQARGSSSMFTVGQVIGGFFSPTTTIVPEEVVFGSPEDRESSQAESAQQWITSQESATVSALEALDRPVPATLTVVEVAEGSGGYGILEVDDVIVGFDGEATLTYNDLSLAMDGRNPGETVYLTVERGGVERELEFPLVDNGYGEGVMGIWIDPHFQIPISVDVKIDTVGGPSAGSMFALAIMDLLTPEDELGGARIAGTGTIDVDGVIGPIGGVHLKMAGARAAGADYFLVPTSNCPGVIGHIPTGLNVYAVDTLDEAYDAVVAIGQGKTSDLPTCTQSKDDS